MYLEPRALSFFFSQVHFINPIYFLQISLIYTIVVGISIEAKNKWKWWQVCVLVTGTVFIISCCFMLTVS